MTMVLTHAGAQVPSRWAALDVDSVQAGVAAIARRKGTEDRNIGGRSERTPPTNRNVANLDTRAKSIGADHVVWTDLPPKFDGPPRVIAEHEDFSAWLRCLTGERATWAEEYVRRTRGDPHAPSSLDRARTVLAPPRVSVEASPSNSSGAAGRGQPCPKQRTK